MGLAGRRMRLQFSVALVLLGVLVREAVALLWFSAGLVSCLVLVECMIWAWPLRVVLLRPWRGLDLEEVVEVAHGF